MTLAASLPSPAKVNITLAFVSSYCAIKYTQYNSSLVSNFTEAYDPSYMNLNDNSGFVWYSDIGMLAAVEKVNEDASVLPGVHVNVKRFTDCGSWDPSAAANYAGNSGGYAAAVTAMEIAELYPEVIGAIGDEYSTATSGIAEILSQYQIPYCANSASSPIFSDKNKYPYFWRTMPIGFGPPFILLLKEWEVKQVSIIYQKDDLFGSSISMKFKDMFAKAGIHILENIGLLGAFDTRSIQYAAQRLLNADSRYNIISGTSLFIANIMSSMGEAGLTGPTLVWMAVDYPTQLPNFQSNNYLKGLIVVSVGFYIHTPVGEQAVHETNAIAQAKMTISDFDSNDVSNAYDCVMMMLKGFEKLLKSNPTYTLEMLSQRKLQSKMNYTLFLDLNYSGATADPMVLDENGELEFPSAYLAYTGDYFNLSTFAVSNVAATAFSWYNVSIPIFYNGYSLPPLDGPIPLPQRSYTIHNSEGITITSTSALGLVWGLCCLVFLVVHRNNETAKTTSLPEVFQLVLGCIINYAGLFLYLNAVTEGTCRARSAMALLAPSLVLLPIVVKNIFLICIFTTGRAYKSFHVLKKVQTRFRWANAGGVGLALVLVIVWVAKSKVKFVEIRTSDYSFFTCQVQNNGIELALYTIDIALFAGLMYAILRQRVVQSQNHDDSTTLTILAFAILIGCSVLGATETDERDFGSDLRVALCLWAFTTISLVTVVVPIAAAVVQARREAFRADLMPRSEQSGLRKSVRTCRSQESESQLRGSTLSGFRNRDGGQEASKLFVRGDSALLASATSNSVGGPQPAVKLHLLQHSTKFVVWRTRTGRMSMWSPWSTGIASINTIHEKKVWLSITSSRQTPCFPLTPNNLPTINGNCIGCKGPTKPSLEVQMEFKDNLHARAFLTELAESLTKFGVSFSEMLTVAKTSNR